MPDVLNSSLIDSRLLILDNALSFGEMYQNADGRAMWYPTNAAKSSGQQAQLDLTGNVTVTKTSGIVFLDGQDVYWDHSENKTIDWPADDRDFKIGTANDDADSTAIFMAVHLNAIGRYLIDSARDGFLHVPVGSANAPMLRQVGGWHKLTFSAANEAQKLDLLSMRGFALDAKWIAEFYVNVIDGGATAAVDFNIGVANATDSDNADDITESAFFHLDGNDLNLFAESDDGTVEVAATDTTVDIALGTIWRGMIDGRNPADLQYYVNGANVLPSTVFDISAAAGPLKLLAHLEKSAATDTADYYVYMRVRTMEQ